MKKYRILKDGETYGEYEDQMEATSTATSVRTQNPDSEVKVEPFVDEDDNEEESGSTSPREAKSDEHYA